MTEQEYTIETLCTCYSLKRLNDQLYKLYNGIKQDGPDIIDDAPINILEKAISCYNDKEYQTVREQIAKDKLHYGII